MADSSEIAQFLHEVKHSDMIDFVQTEKNRQTRLSIGLTIIEQDDIIRNLTVSEYYSGPLKDHDKTKPEQIWIFKHNHKGHTLYIKLKEKIIVEGKTIIKCLSCHIDFM